MQLVRNVCLPIFLAVASPLWGQTLQCGRTLQVVASGAALANRACTVFVRETPMIVRCDLLQTRPVVLRIEDDPTELPLMGHYRTKNNEIRIRAPSGLAEILDESSAYSRIAPEQLFDSVIVHEMAHAFFANTLCGRETCLAGHEYIAFAMKLQSLSRRDRQALIDGLLSSSTVELSWFTDEQLHETPELFAANAWRHFSQPGFGCAFIKTIVAGETVFPSETE